MPRAPLLQLSDIALTFGGAPIFQGLDAVIQTLDRIALVGRNGSGKSTLLKVMAGLVQPDSGTRAIAPATTVRYLEQDPDLSGHVTLGDFALSDIAPADTHRVEIEAEGLNLELSKSVDEASGGERRRAALARLMASRPDLMLLDEPTNHLDIVGIRALEERLRSTKSAFVLISHDRAFLTALTRATLWIDRGCVRRVDRGFDAFEAWRDKTWEAEDLARHKLDRKIKAEARWAVEGISARRKRNMGRVRALADLRATRAEQIQRQGAADLELAKGPKSGRRVIDAQRLSKRFGDQVIAREFSMRIQRGDRVALVGPNGVGKSTLLKLLTGEVAPDAGTVSLGTNLNIAVFDQNRDQLDGDASLWENLTGTPATRVSGRADQVMVRGQPRHVVGYLKDFLFDESQARTPVRALSGGEQARLLLARIMARESNLLVLDEPTNDLDVETLDLLQDVLGDFDGTVLLVSHDRDFIDRVATTTIAMEGDGDIGVYPGGWADYQRQRPTRPGRPEPRREKPSAPTIAASPEKSTGAPDALTFTERHRLKALPAEIARLEAEIAKLEALLSDPDLYTREPVKFAKATEALVVRQEALSKAEEEWLNLEDRASSG